MVTVGKNDAGSENHPSSQSTEVQNNQDRDGKNNDIHHQLFGHRKQREFIAESEKDETYWDRRRRNNEAAKRSREKRRVNDMMLESRVMELTKENSLLRGQLEAIYDHYEAVSRTGGVMTLPPLPRALANIVHPPTQIHPRIRVAHIPGRGTPYDFPPQGVLPGYHHQDQRFMRRLGGWGESQTFHFQQKQETEVPRESVVVHRDLQRDVCEEPQRFLETREHRAPPPLVPVTQRHLFRTQTEMKPEKISRSPRHYREYDEVVECESEVLNLSSEATGRSKVSPEQSMSPASNCSTSGAEDEAYHSSNTSSPVSHPNQQMGGHLPHKLRFKASPSLEEAGLGYQIARTGYKRTLSESESEFMNKIVKQET